MFLIPHKYAYLVGTLIFFIPWLILFWHRKDLRKEMIVMSIIASFAGISTAYFWTQDWWRPYTITGTRIGIEDLLLGISNGGIAAVLYEEVFRRKLYKRKSKEEHNKGLLFLVIVNFIFFLVILYGLKTTSFYAFLFSMISFCVALVILRRDLLISSLINGLLMVLMVLPVYYILIIFSPGLIDKIYLFDTLSGIRITGIPIEELVFYYLFGFVGTLFYEYWQGWGLVKMPIKWKQNRF